MTLTDLNQNQIRRSPNPVHYVYVFHSMISTHMKYLPGAFDYYDSIFCVGPHHIKEILKREELHELQPKNLVKTGNYLLERIYSEYQKHLAEKPTVDEKTTILIAPSWGDNNVIENCGEDLVELLLKEGYEVIVRPHPETVRRFPHLLKTFTIKFGKNSAFTLEKSVASCESLLKSDVLICDSSGVALEYAFGTSRPVLFLDVPYMVRNENYKELDLEVFELSIRKEIGVVASHENLDEIPKIIENLKADRMNYKKQIEKLREQNVFAFGNSPEIGAQYILDIIREKKVDKEEKN